MNAGRLALALIALTLASGAHAEKYIEVWNPPEARGHTVTPRPGQGRMHAQTKTLATTQPRLAKKVTEPAAASANQGERGASSVASSKRSSSNKIIPRKIGPDGNVFRV